MYIYKVNKQIKMNIYIIIIYEVYNLYYKYTYIIYT